MSSHLPDVYAYIWIPPFSDVYYNWCYTRKNWINSVISCSKSIQWSSVNSQIWFRCWVSFLSMCRRLSSLKSDFLIKLSHIFKLPIYVKWVFHSGILVESTQWIRTNLISPGLIVVKPKDQALLMISQVVLYLDTSEV